MFVPLPGQTHLGIVQDQVVAVIESINSPNIAVPDIGSEPAKAYIVGVQLPSGGYSVAIYLLMLHTNTPVIYRPEPVATTVEGYPEMESTAIQFTESMGFMLENLNFRAQSAPDIARMVETLPFFHDQAPPLAQGVTIPDDMPMVESVVGQVIETVDEESAAAIGRLLGSF